MRSEGKAEALSMEERKDKSKYSMVPSDYKLLEEVGQGVSGFVYRALYTPHNEHVAIKQLDLEKCNGTLDSIRKEAQTMSLINHPNVVRAHCSFVVGQHLWVVMPYMGGGSCLHIMKAAFPDGLEEPVIATILRDTLKALEYLHRQGHIHRDVKAGNILMDEIGGVKLGDFGVAACMFDTGDRQWSRNTFVGTPCWMAPEVMEQLNGYDFKADIWSFGITALELAHGHAPFSKYPPMKVLLMTLQNAPPGLTYERDRRFSKSFKEMIAMCLVKDPTKRPTAEKLLKHSFFKYAKSSDYISRHVLEGLPPLWERVRNVKLRDAARLAEKKMPYGEQEERSQNEYKRGVSGWNFDVEDLKAQAALIQDDDFAPVQRKDDEAGTCKDSVSLHSTAPGDENHENLKAEMKAEVAIDGEECILRTTSLPCSKPLMNGAKTKGRFNVFLGNMEVDTSNSTDGLDREDAPPVQNDERELDGDKDVKVANGIIEKDDHVRLETESSVPSKYADDEKERESRQGGRSGEDHSRVPHDKGGNEHRANGLSKPPSGSKDEEKMKGHVVQKKGRFSVTSEGVELKDLKEQSKEAALPCVKVKSSINPADHGGEVLSPSSLRRSSSSQQVAAQLCGTPTTPSPAPPPAPVTVAAILPHLQSLLNQTAMQQDMIVGLMTNVCNGDASAGAALNQRLSRSVSANTVDHGGSEAWSERERELRQQVTELQGRVGALVDELQSIKLRNVQLERQLNAIFNKEEEERIRKEEAAKEDG